VIEPSDDEQLLTVADIAAHVGAHESTVRAWIKTGELRATKFGARLGWRIRRGDYREFLRRRTLAGAVARELLAATRQ
jgi:excisionase family DNA binding protein